MKKHDGKTEDNIVTKGLHDGKIEDNIVTETVQKSCTSENFMGLEKRR